MSYFRNLAKEAEGPVGRGWEGVEKMDKDGMQDINVSKGLEEERRLAEERKKLTAPDLYSEESTYKVSMSGLLYRNVLLTPHTPTSALRLSAGLREKQANGTS
jgi:hypothetical protein